ncbi:MAG: hypothetical protein KAU01_08815 [Candidatus Cloacimonetes bacterium]|nr:hypothetical protein [Candidatus Cloacimonadota bacterium]
MKTIYFVLVFLILSTFLFSTIINVPGDQPTIQLGINAATNTDSVLVQPGTYVENINFSGKLITVGSLYLTTQDTTYISSTIIDGNNYSTVVGFYNGENSTAVLCGFTITNGNASGSYPGDSGGGISCYYSSPSLQNLSISGNSADVRGGGISCNESSPILENVTISGNTVSYTSGCGGGINCYENSNPSLSNVTISGNSADYGGGIYCDSSSPSLVNVTISDNSAYYGAGIFCWYNSNPSLENVTISVYASDDPYTGFVEDTSGSFVGESWSTSIMEVKKFYYVTASTETIRSKNSHLHDVYHYDRKSKGYDSDKFKNRKRK